MAGFDIDHDRLRQHGRDIEYLGASSGDQLRTLQDGLAGEGTPWGADEAENVFGSAYQELLAATDDILRLFPDGLQDVGRNLQDAADDLKSTDEDARQRFKTVTDSLQERS